MGPVKESRLEMSTDWSILNDQERSGAMVWEAGLTLLGAPMRTRERERDKDYSRRQGSRGS